MNKQLPNNVDIELTSWAGWSVSLISANLDTDGTEYEDWINYRLVIEYKEDVPSVHQRIVLPFSYIDLNAVIEALVKLQAKGNGNEA